MNKDKDKKTFTVIELADILGKSRETIRRWLRSGELTYTAKSERKSLISYDDLLNFVARHPDAISVTAQRRLGLTNSLWDEMDAAAFLGVEYASGETTADVLVKMLADRFNEDMERLKEISRNAVQLHKSRVVIEGDMQTIEEFRKKLTSDDEDL